jgi:hypothetical protein
MKRQIQSGLLPWAVVLVIAALLPAAAQAVPGGCLCPAGSWSLMSGTIGQNTCTNLESNLLSNLQSFANSNCSPDGACFGSYTTQYPACTISTDDPYMYIQSGTLQYKCVICPY